MEGFEGFLDALPRTLADVVSHAVSQAGMREQLEQAARGLADADGRMPSSKWTAEMVALDFLRSVRVQAPPDLAADITDVLDRRTSRSSGDGPLAPALVGLATGAATVGSAAGLKIFTDKQLQKQWDAHVGDVRRFRDLIHAGLGMVIRNVTSTADWDLLGRTATKVGFDPDIWETEVAGRLGDGLTSNLAGILGRAAWSGQRNALDSLPQGTELGDFQQATQGWVREYTARLVEGQKALSARAARESIHRYLESGLPEQTIASRLKMIFPLSPGQALAVDNYRHGLHKQGKPKGVIDRLARAYAGKMTDHKKQLLARTEANASLNFGRQLMMEQAVRGGTLPTDTLKAWVTAGDEWVCPVCRPMDGSTTTLQGAFETSSGPVLVPPVHPQCRCIIIPSADRREAFEKRTVTVSEHTRSVGGREITVPEHEREVGDEVTAVDSSSNWGKAAVVAGIAGAAGALLLTRGRIKTGGIVSSDKITDALEQGPKATDSAWNPGAIHEVARKVNAGEEITGSPRQLLDEAMKSWEINSRGMRDYYENGRVPDLGIGQSPPSRESLDFFTDAIAYSPASEQTLYRGMRLEGDDLARFTAEGETIPMGPSSFTSSQKRGQFFSRWTEGMSARPSGDPVVLRTAGSHRSLRVESLVGEAFRKEREWVSGGEFRVRRARRADIPEYGAFGEHVGDVPGWDVEIEQVGGLVSRNSEGLFGAAVGKGLVDLAKAKTVTVQAHTRQAPSGETVEVAEHEREVESAEGFGALDSAGAKLAMGGLAAALTVVGGAAGIRALTPALRGMAQSSEARVAAGIWEDVKGLSRDVPTEVSHFMDQAHSFSHKGTSLSTIGTWRWSNPRQATLWSDLDRGSYVSLGVIRRRGVPMGGFLAQMDDAGRTVHHHAMFMPKRAQGGGFATAFRDHAYGAYQQAGIESVKMRANWSVGGYTWANQGFHFDRTVGVGGEASNLTQRMRDHYGSLSEAQQTQLQGIASRLGEAHDSPNYPTPWEIAEVGIDQPYTRTLASGKQITSWPGKDIMLGSQWWAEFDLTTGFVPQRRATPSLSKAVAMNQRLFELAGDLTDADHERFFDPGFTSNEAGYDDYNLAPGLVDGDLDRKILLQARDSAQVGKRTVHVEAYTREDGTEVQAHTREVGGSGDRRSGTSGRSRTSTTSRLATVAGTSILAGAAVATWRIPGLRRLASDVLSRSRQGALSLAEPSLSNRVGVPWAERLSVNPSASASASVSAIGDDLLSSLTGRNRKQTLANVENEFFSNPFESKAVIAGDGSIAAAARGDDFAAGFLADDVTRAKRGDFTGMTLTHNHPSHNYAWSGSETRYASGPLTPSDVQSQLTAGYGEMRAVGAEGTYRMRMDPNISAAKANEVRGDVNELNTAMFTDWQQRGWVSLDGDEVVYHNWLDTSDSLHTGLAALADRHRDVFSYDFIPARDAPTSYAPTFRSDLWDSVQGRDYQHLREFMHATDDGLTIRDFTPSVVTAAAVGETTRRVAE